MLFVGIDLAERMSAAVVIDSSGTVLHETCLDAGKQETPANPWKNIGAVREWWKDLYYVVGGRTAHYVIETPHFHARNGEPALMVQGGLLSAMLESGINPAYTQRIPAMEWQRYFGFTKADHGNTKTWAEDYSRLYFGYTPGMTWPENSRMIKKMREDLIDARLLAQWLKETL